ncbi:hypothetical protein D1831_09665 [Lactiplantibacillus garii]|uniref:DNA mismatch repair proteins mutS family domain-containing protein n=1 Tax=Lactiplantibacillus garii TaxID=2306423 RepID=A0A426D5W1_9LACO|nr:hypothetical protein [Lactiplantibacillus garii]RRK10015.1 hypothetical protein D1831_09665 [Lactiplantibacillus garii]
MNDTIKQTLQLDQILDTVAELTHSQLAADQLRQSSEQTDLNAVKAELTLTHEAHQLLAADVQLTFYDLDQLTVIKTKLDQGRLLNPGQLQTVLAVLTSWSRLKTVLGLRAEAAPNLARLAADVTPLSGLKRRLEQTLDRRGIRDTATPELARLRQVKRQRAAKVQSAIAQFIQKHPAQLQSRQVIQRDQHYGVQLKATYKNRFTGMALGQSATGSTVYFEPGNVAQSGRELAATISDEEAEVYQIIATLTGDVDEHWDDLQHQVRAFSRVDQIFARGRYGLDNHAILPELNQRQIVTIKDGRHPLLGSAAVPLNVHLDQNQSLMITGANSGGKTVVLKTIALFSLMVKVGLEIPAAAGTNLAVFDQILIDIGDQQNMAAQLSTFSGEMTTLVAITDNLRPNALVLMDEIGSGTDPEEGAALGIAIIDDLIQRHAKLIVTTHYSEIKQYAVATPAFVTGAMAFNRETLRPEYRLLLNQVGESEAMWLAARLGLNPRIVAAARARLAHQ